MPMLPTLELLRERHSVRDYDLKEVPAEIVKSLQADLTMTNTHEAGLWFQMRLNDDDPFRGFKRSYGMFKNPRNYVACVIEPSYPDTVERAGYYAEQFVIKAVGRGLATCFVGGTFDSSAVNVPLRAGQKILMLLLFGYAADKVRPLMSLLSGAMKGKRKPAEFYWDDKETSLEDAEREFPWLRAGLEGIACAPSWANGRPVRIHIREVEGARRVCAFVDTSKDHRLIDLGIAKYNFAMAAAQTGAAGDWMWGNDAPFLTD